MFPVIFFYFSSISDTPHAPWWIASCKPLSVQHKDSLTRWRRRFLAILKMNMLTLRNRIVMIDTFISVLRLSIWMSWGKSLSVVL